MTYKIAFFIARYSRSGVPLAQVRLAKALQRQGFKVEFITGCVEDGCSLPAIEGMRTIDLKITRTHKLLWPIMSYVRKNQPDVIFSAEDHLNVVVTLAVILVNSKARLSVSSRVTPYDTYSNKLFSKKWILKKMSAVLRMRCDALTCVSRDMVDQYVDTFGPSPYQCVYNVIWDRDAYQKIDEAIDDPWFDKDSVPIIITAGRLSPEKGFADLILAIKALSKDRIIRLLILGEGPLAGELRTLIERERIGDSIRLLGFQENPLKYFSRSKVFVLSSYVEGLPNVLVEAMACGCTPVATDCPTGPREVLQDGKYGYLVPMRDPPAMAAAIAKALEQPVSTDQLKQAVEPFTEERVVAQHRRILGI